MDSVAQSPNAVPKYAFNSIVVQSALDPNIGTLQGANKGKRLHAVHGNPKSATFEGQLEYLDQIATKYQQLIDTEQTLKH